MMCIATYDIVKYTEEYEQVVDYKRITTSIKYICSVTTSNLEKFQDVLKDNYKIENFMFSVI